MQSAQPNENATVPRILNALGLGFVILVCAALFVLLFVDRTVAGDATAGVMALPLPMYTVWHIWKRHHGQDVAFGHWRWEDKVDRSYLVGTWRFFWVSLMYFVFFPVTVVAGIGSDVSYLWELATSLGIAAVAMMLLVNLLYESSR